jgi:hypothetical protein
MKIGIISDTHRKVKKAKIALKMLIQNGAKFIIHAGDIVEKETLDFLKESGLKYVAVYGNNDEHLLKYQDKYNLVQEPYYFKLAHVKFKLMHLPYYMKPDADVIIYGHTHMFDCEYKQKTLFLNSGEVCARKKPISECMMLEVNDNEFIVTQYNMKDDSDIFTEKRFKIKREK